jgi:hypothetical protein
MEKTMEKGVSVRNKQRKMAMEITKVLQDKFNTKALVSWISGEDPIFIIDRYMNSFDYRRYYVKYIKGEPAIEYLNTIKYADSINKYKLHKASMQEKMLIGAIDGINNIWIDDGELHFDKFDPIYISDITNIEVDNEQNLMNLRVDENGDIYLFKIDLNKGEVIEM